MIRQERLKITQPKKIIRMWLLGLGLFSFLVFQFSAVAQGTPPQAQERPTGAAPNVAPPPIGNMLTEENPAPKVSQRARVPNDIPPRADVPSQTLPPDYDAQNLISNEKTALRLQWQWQSAPDDPLFLHENRYIPELDPPPEFIAPSLKQEIIVERLGEGVEDYKAILQKYKPTHTQFAIFVLALLLYVAYHLQNRKKRKSKRRIFKVKR